MNDLFQDDLNNQTQITDAELLKKIWPELLAVLCNFFSADSIMQELRNANL